MKKGGRPRGDRDLRVADFVRDELALILQQQMRDPRVGMVSVNEVTVSRDLAFADVYVSSLEAGSADEREALVTTLSKAAGWMRSELAKRHRMRTTPKLRFHYDELIESAPRMEKLIDQAIAADASEHNQDG